MIRSALLITSLLISAPTILANAQRVSLDLESATVDYVLKQLRSQAGVQIVYDTRTATSITCRNIHFDRAEVDEVLKSVLASTPLEYYMVGEVYVVKQRQAAVQQPVQNVLKGRVVNARGEPLSGAAILVRESNISTTSDAEGRFTLRLPSAADAVFEVRYVGMATRTIPVAGITDQAVLRGQKEYVVTLREERVQIGEVVVTGYQVIDRRRLTSSVATIKPEDLDRVGVLTVDQMLEGKAPGLMISQISAQPGAAAKVRIRSSGTFTGSREPLWVIDGIIYEAPVELDAAQINSLDAVNYIGNAISGLNPLDIEQIDILKDASATAIYGSRAANGVIVIKTKRGKTGRNSLMWSSSFNVTQRPAYSDFNLMSSKERIDVSREMAEKGIVFPNADVLDTQFKTQLGYEAAFIRYQQDADFTAFQTEVSRLEELNFDWFNALYRNSINQSHNFSLSGGSENNRYYVSLGYDDQLGTERNIELQRFTARTNIDVNLYRNVIFSIGVDGSSQRSQYNHPTVNVFNDAYYGSRAVGTHNPDGSYLYRLTRQFRKKADNYIHEDYFPGYNTLNEMEQTGKMYENRALNMNLDFQWEIVKGIRYGLRGAYRTTSSYYEETAGSKSYAVARHRAAEEDLSTLNMTTADKLTQQYYGRIPMGGMFGAGTVNQDAYTLRNTLSLIKTLGGKHLLNLDLIHELSQVQYKGTTEWSVPGYVENQGYQFIKPSNVPSKATYDGYYYEHYNFTDYYYQAMITWLTGQNGLSVYPKIQRTDNRTTSFVGIFTYSYDDRYIFNVNMRNDGSNAFGQYEKNRFRPTWSVSGRWNTHHEPFMEDLRAIEELALRLSYGIRGAAPNTSPYLILQNYGQTNAVAYPEYLATVSSFPNADLRWEKTQTINAGMNLSLLGNRLNIVLDYAYDYSSDLLLRRDISLVNGRGTEFFNGGAKESRTFEINLRGDIVRMKDWAWNFSLNLTSIKENIITGTEDTQLNADSFVNGTILRKGFPVDGFFAYRFSGLDEEGKPIFGDPDKTYNSTLEAFRDALLYQGNLLPKCYGGFGTEVRYRNLVLSAFFTYKLGHKVRMLSLYSGSAFMPLSYENMSREFVDRWRQPGDQTAIPGLSNNANPSKNNLSGTVTGGRNGLQLYDDSEIRVARGDYIRWGSLTLSYRVPKAGPLRQAIVRFQATNLGVWAFDKKLKGQDPDQVRNVGMPVLPSYTIGITLGF